MTIPANDFHYFEQINALVQQEPVEALDPEIMGSLAAIGIVKGKPFNPMPACRKFYGRGSRRHRYGTHPQLAPDDAKASATIPTRFGPIIWLSAVTISKPRRRW